MRRLKSEEDDVPAITVDSLLVPLLHHNGHGAVGHARTCLASVELLKRLIAPPRGRCNTVGVQNRGVSSSASEEGNKESAGFPLGFDLQPRNGLQVAPNRVLIPRQVLKKYNQVKCTCMNSRSSELPSPPLSHGDVATQVASETRTGSSMTQWPLLLYRAFIMKWICRLQEV